MPSLAEMLRQKKEEQEIVPRKRKTQPKPIKKPVKPVVIRKEKIGTSYITSNDPELIQYKEKIEKLQQKQSESRREFLNRRIKMRLTLDEMTNKKLGKPINLEIRYRIETECRPFYNGTQTYGFKSWLDNQKLTTKQRKKHENLENKHTNDDVKESKETEKLIDETEEETIKEEHEKTEASVQGIVNDIQFMKCELNFLKHQFKAMKNNGTNGYTTPIERIKQDNHRPERNLNKTNFGSVITEMKKMFSRIENVCELLNPVNGRNSIETPPVILA